MKNIPVLIHDDPVRREQHSLECSEPGCFPQNPIKDPRANAQKINPRTEHSAKVDEYLK